MTEAFVGIWFLRFGISSIGNSKNQIPNPNDRGVRWALVLEIWNFVNRRVCGCGHRVGLKNRRRWFDSNTLHWKTRNPKLEIRNRELCLVRLAGSGRWPLKPETPGSKPARDTLRKSQEPRTKSQTNCVVVWFLGFGSWRFSTLGCGPHGRL